LKLDKERTKGDDELNEEVNRREFNLLRTTSPKIADFIGVEMWLL
jgi:hypothetical protein